MRPLTDFIAPSGSPPFTDRTASPKDKAIAVTKTQPTCDSSFSNEVRSERGADPEPRVRHPLLCPSADVARLAPRSLLGILEFAFDGGKFEPAICKPLNMKANPLLLAAIARCTRSPRNILTSEEITIALKMMALRNSCIFGKDKSPADPCLALQAFRSARRSTRNGSLRCSRNACQLEWEPTDRETCMRRNGRWERQVLQGRS